jgi:non-heme chloroperoxidase
LFTKQRRNNAITRLQEIPGRGHSLVFDSGWQGAADAALQFLKESEHS